MKSFYKIYDRFVPEQICDFIVQAAQDTPLQDATINTYGETADPSHRVSGVRWLPTYNWHISPFVLYTACEANKEWKFQVDPEIVALQFTEYHGEKKSHFSWHNDVLLDKDRHRKLSVIIQLSDPSEYEGGKLEMEPWVNFDDTAFRNKGSVLVMPSYMQHRVTPVTSGSRYSLVSWLEGEQLK